MKILIKYNYLKKILVGTHIVAITHWIAILYTTRFKRSLIDLKDTQKIPKRYPKDTQINISQNGRRGKESHS